MADSGSGQGDRAPSAPASSDARKAGRRSRAALLVERLDRNVVTAFLMVVIAVFGALTAYGSAVNEQRAIELERRLTTGQLLDIGFRQQWLVEINYRVGLETLRDTLKREGKLARAAAGSNNEDEVAAWLKGRAFEFERRHMSLGTVLSGLMDFTAKSSAQELANRSISNLQEQGFAPLGVSADDAPSYDPCKATERGGLGETESQAENHEAEKTTPVPDEETFAWGAAQPSIRFPSLECGLERAHEGAKKLDAIAVAFVGALVCLTLALLYARRWRVWLSWVLAGAGVFVLSAGSVLYVDFSAWRVFALLAIAFGALMVLAARRGLFLKDHPHRGSAAREASHGPGAEMPEPKHPQTPHLTAHVAHDSQSRAVILLISFAVFASAVFTALYTYALGEAGHFAIEAQTMRAEWTNNDGRIRTVATAGALNSFAGRLDLRIGCAAATELSQLRSDKMIATGGSIAFSTEECGDLKTYEGPNEDTISENFDRFDVGDSAASPASQIKTAFMDQAPAPNENVGLSNGYSEISANWNIRGARTLAVLAFLAVAIYLLAQAHAMSGTRAARWLITAGLLLGAAGLSVGAWAWSTPLLARGMTTKGERTADRHCSSALTTAYDPEEFVRLSSLMYVEGVRNLDQAEKSEGLRGQSDVELERKAIDALHCAIEIRAGFLPAYRNYVDALRSFNTPQRAERFRSLDTFSYLSDIVRAEHEELRQFADQGLSISEELLGGFAFDSVELALTRGRQEDMSTAEAALDVLTGGSADWPWLQTIASEWARPEFHNVIRLGGSAGAVEYFNRGLALLATADPKRMEEAVTVYRRGFEKQSKSPVEMWRWRQLLAATLTDLEMLRAYCPRLYPEGDACARIDEKIDVLEPRIATGALDADGGQAMPAVQDFSVAAAPGKLSWRVNIKGLDPKRDRLSVAWFRDDRPSSSLAPECSARETDQRWCLLFALELPFRLYASTGQKDETPPPRLDGDAYQDSWSAVDDHTCLPSGAYEARIFLNGRQAASARVTIAPPATGTADDDWRIFDSRELDVSWCIPRSWQPWSNNPSSHPWFPDKPMKAFVRSPGKLGGAVMNFIMPVETPKAKREAYLLRRSIGILMQKDAKGSDWKQATEDALVSGALAREALEGEECASNDPLRLVVYKFLDNQDAKADDGSAFRGVRLAILSGDIGAKDACAILDSMRPYYTP